MPQYGINFFHYCDLRCEICSIYLVGKDRSTLVYMVCEEDGVDLLTAWAVNMYLLHNQMFSITILLPSCKWAYGVIYYPAEGTVWQYENHAPRCLAYVLNYWQNCLVCVMKSLCLPSFASFNKTIQIWVRRHNFQHQSDVLFSQGIRDYWKLVSGKLSSCSSG